MISFSLKVIFISCLDGEVEGSKLLYNTDNYYQPTQHHTPEDINLLQTCCRNLKSCTYYIFYFSFSDTNNFTSRDFPDELIF